MFAAKVKLHDAETVKTYLLKHNLLHPDFSPLKEFDYLFFPLNKKAKVPHAEVATTHVHFPSKRKPMRIEDLLQGTLSQKQLKLLPKSQEIVGNILILEVPEEFLDKEKAIAEAYLKLHPHVTTVVKKDQMHEGVFRTRKVKILAGRKTKETIHVESGVKIQLHLEKTYFSARTANERLRVAKLVKPGEEILVMFSGAGPFPLVLAKHSLAKKIWGIELNTFAHAYALNNIEMNNFQDKIELYAGDVRVHLPKIKKKFDRVLLPLPKTSDEFLDVALPRVKKGGIVHLYRFLDEQDVAQEVKKVKAICAGLGHPVTIIRKVKCGQFSPGRFRYCFDMKVLK